MVPRYALLFLALVVTSPVHHASAQAPADRAALELFRDSLSVSRDTLPLLALEAKNIAVAKAHRDDAIIHIRLGFIALRIGEVARNIRHVDDAAGEFEWATELRPDWPFPWFGLGLAEAAFPDRAKGFAGGFWTMLGIDRDTRAGDAFLRSIRADPSFVDGILEFSETARDQRIDAPIVAALDALRAVTSSPLGWHPDLLMERGRLERLAGNADSARIAFQRALLLSTDPAFAQLELARTLPLTADTVSRRIDGETPVEVAYYAGAESDEPDVVAGYRRDLQPMVNDSTLKAFDEVSGVARVEWLHAFWRKAAAADLRAPAARLAEHFRRWDAVLRRFRLPPFHRAYAWGIETYHSGDRELDDRGIVWLRQGPPTTRILWPDYHQEATLATLMAPVPRTFRARRDSTQMRRTGGLNSRSDGRPMFNALDVTDPDTYGNETWRYVRPDGDLVLHFVARQDPNDYRLVESIFDLNIGVDAMVHEERNLPGLQPMLTAGRFSQAEMAQEDRIRGKKAIATATTTNSWTRTYPITLGGRVQWLAAGERNGMPLVHIVYAVDATMLRALAGKDTTRALRLKIRAVMLDVHGNPVAMLDTLQLVPRPSADARLVAMRAELPAPPGWHQVRFGVELNAMVGGTYPLDSLVVPDIHGDTLALSSLLIGVPRQSLPWQATLRDTAWINAASYYAPTDTMMVYFEAYGVHPGTPYTMRLAVTRQQGAISRLLGGHHDAIALTEQLTFAGGIGKVARAVDLAGLEPGTYVLELAVESGKHRMVRRRVIVVH